MMSLNYANFGIQEALQYRIAWQNAHPGQKASPVPQLEKLPDYFMQVCYRVRVCFMMSISAIAIRM